MLFTHNDYKSGLTPGAPIRVFGYPGRIDARGRAVVEVPEPLTETELAAGRLTPLDEPGETPDSQGMPARVKRPAKPRKDQP